MKNTSILKRIMGLALSLALLVSMMPMLASEVYAAGAGESVHIYKENGITPATLGQDYTIESDVRYCLKADNLRVTTKGFVVRAAFALDNPVNKATFEDCRVFIENGPIIEGDETQHDQTINISGDCDFMCNNGGLAILFKCTGGHKIKFTSSDENNSLDIENYGQAIEVNDGSLTFAGEINATITGDCNNNFIKIDKDFHITDNADVKVSCVNIKDHNNGITSGDDMTMDGNSKLNVTARDTAITVENNGKLLIRENASLTASSYHYVVAKTEKEAAFDTTGRVELTNYNSDGLLCEKLKVLNRDGTVLIRGRGTTAIKLKSENDITLGNEVKMYASTDLNEPEQSINKEFVDVDVKWKKEGSAPADYYHPYFVIDGDDKAIQAVLIKGVSEIPVGPGGGSTDSGEIEKIKKDLASADAKIEELDEQLQELVKTLMSTKTKFSKLNSSSKRKVVMKFNKIPGAQKYEIKYKQHGQKWKTLTTRKTSVKFKKLKSGKKFYVKVRGLFEKDSLKISSPWSNKKSIRVK